MAQNENDSEHSEHEELYKKSTTTNQSKCCPKSFVWDYFDKDNNGITAICKVILDNEKKCGVSYNDGSTTSNLINHLALEYKSFRKLLHSLDEKFSISCNKTIKTSVSKSFSWSKEQLTSLIEKESVVVSMMIDFWTSHQALLVLQRVLYPHTGEVIAELLDNVLVEWGLINKMTVITTDNGSNDDKRLARIMLSNDEWIFLDELNDILCGFEEITMLLSGNTYVTISLMYPAISTLVKTLKILLQQSYIESASTDMGELTILDSVEEIIDDTKDIAKIKKVDASLRIIHKTINISVPMITIGMLEKIKKVLYDSIYHYWNSVTDVGMLACLLDLHFKKLHFANTNVVIQTKEHLKSLYELEYEIHPTPKYPTSLSNIQHDDHDDFEADLYADDNDKISEIDDYLALEEEGRQMDPFQWWSLKKEQFSILSNIAR
ncbi:474_t:CDS:2, partial [Racocetra persica]